MRGNKDGNGSVGGVEKNFSTLHDIVLVLAYTNVLKTTSTVSKRASTTFASR